MLALQQLWHLSPLANTGYHRKVASDSSFTVDMTHGICITAEDCGTLSLAYHWHSDLKGRYLRCAEVGQDPAGVQNVNLQTRKGLTLVVQGSKTTNMLSTWTSTSHSLKGLGRKAGMRLKKNQVNKL